MDIKCIKCGMVAPEEEFQRDRWRKHGRRPECKACIAKRRNRPGPRDALRETVRRWRKTDRGKELHREAVRRYRKRHPERTRARTAVQRALREGRLVSQPCEECGRSPAEAHHDDYSKPLDVRWLCSEHHTALHAARRRAALGPLAAPEEESRG